MRQIEGPFRVYVGLVPTGYLNSEAIEQVIRDGMAFCGTGRTIEAAGPIRKMLIRVDMTVADAALGRHAYTHPEITRATIAVLSNSAHPSKITVTAESLPELSTPRVFRRANGNTEAFRGRGYFELEHLYPGRVVISPDDEAEACRYHLCKGQVLQNATSALDLSGSSTMRATGEIVTSSEYAWSDFAVYCPKIKSSVFSQGFSGAIRLGRQHHRLGLTTDHHICDMLEVCNPQLVIGDGIVASVGGGEITQLGHELGALLISNNALAHDMIACQILSIDPMSVRHLRIAAERGWGPENLAQIELGGSGGTGIQQLAQKSRFWNLGSRDLEDFREKLRNENPDFKFPLEIVSGAPYEATGAHGALLNWLHYSYDVPARRAQMEKWPKASVCVGGLSSFPSRYVVYSIGDTATRTLRAISSKTRTLYSGKSFSIANVQLKNGRRHLLISIPDETLNRLVATALSSAFAWGSFGRMRAHIARWPFLFDRLSTVLRKLRKRTRPARHLPVVMTSRLRHNRWWALKPRITTRHLDALSAPLNHLQSSTHSEAERR